MESSFSKTPSKFASTLNMEKVLSIREEVLSGVFTNLSMYIPLWGSGSVAFWEKSEWQLNVRRKIKIILNGFGLGMMKKIWTDW